MKKKQDDLLENKQLESKHNNMYSIQDLMNIIQDPEIDIEYRNAVIAVIGGELGSVLAALVSIFVPINIWLTILSIFAMLQTPIIFAIVGILTDEHDGVISKYVATGLFVLELPLIYCVSGGNKGPGLIWFLFAFLVIATVCNGKKAVYMTIACAFVQAFILIVTRVFPSLIFEVDIHKAWLNSLLSFAGISIATLLVLFLQKMLSKANDEYLKQIRKDIEEKNVDLVNTKEELVANNEEITAMNEELMETSEKLVNALEENKRTLEQQRRFTAMLSHELRNPLNGTMGYLQMQLMNPNIPEQFKQGMRDSYVLTESMLQTVNDILDFSKLQEGKFEIVKSDFRLDEVIHNVHTIFDEMAKKKGLELKYNLPEESYTLFSDGTRIQQIIVNLVSNAVKYTEKGSVEITVEVVDSVLDIRVSDTGKGMSRDEVAYIFEPYKRFDLEKNKKIQGTGLGMSIVKKLVDQLDGSIDIDSVEGMGTTFCVSFPVIIRENKEVQDEQVSVDEVEITNKVILAVDDDAINLKVLGKFLEKTGVTIFEAKNGKEALTLINSGRCKIDLVLTDNLMPEMTGCELKEYMNAHDINIPAIILSGDMEKESLDTFKKLGFVDILAKPIIHTKLIQSVERVLS